jgi:hypothetical protein
MKAIIGAANDGNENNALKRVKQIYFVPLCNTPALLKHVISPKYRNAFGFAEQQPMHCRRLAIICLAAGCASAPDSLHRVSVPQNDNFHALCTPFLRVNPIFRLYFSVVKMWTSTILARFRSLGTILEPKKMREADGGLWQHGKGW